MRRLLLLIGLVVVAGLLFANAALVLPVCGLVGGVGLFQVEFCPQSRSDDVSAIHEGRMRKSVLELRVAQLQRQIDARICESVEVVVIPPPPRPSVQADEVAEEAMEPLPASEQPDIDPEDWRNEDISLLDGCWNLDSDYATEDVVTGEISGVGSWIMCFDKDGNGDQVLVYKSGVRSGVRCGSELSAWFEDGQLIIHDPGNMECSDGGNIYRREMVCDLVPGGFAECQSIAPEDPRPGGPSWYSFRLHR